MLFKMQTIVYRQSLLKQINKNSIVYMRPSEELYILKNIGHKFPSPEGKIINQ